MDAGLKQRLIGAAVLVALAVIFLPMLVKGPAPDSGVSDLSMRVPDAPERGYRTVDLPLVVPAEAPEGGVLAPEPLDDGQLPTVDTATAPRAAESVDDAQPNPDAADLAEDVPAPAASPTPAPQAPAAPPAAAARAPATPAPAQPLPAATAGGHYVVHFGAFGSERDAQLIVRQLAQAGLSAYSEAFTLQGRPAQRVRLGPFATREAAEAVRVRAAQVRGDVTPRVVAMDASPARSTAPAPAPVAAQPATQPRTQPAAPASTPAQTPAPPTPAPTAAAGVGFAVQLGAFGNAAEATRLRDRLRGMGIDAFTDTVNTDRGRLTRVKAGPVPGREDAERLKAQVKSKVGIDGMVRAHP